MSARVAAILVFSAGVLCAVLFGCIIAAYDLWGGVPRERLNLVRALSVVAFGFMTTGAIWFVRAQPAQVRWRAVMEAVGVLGVVAVVTAIGLVTYYLVRWDSSRAICENARRLPLRADRERELRRGLGPLFPVIDPNGECLSMKHELDDLRSLGTCPEFTMDDAPCICADQRWTGAADANRCSNGPTTCQTRRLGTSQRLGCEHPRAF